VRACMCVHVCVLLSILARSICNQEIEWRNKALCTNKDNDFVSKIKWQRHCRHHDRSENAITIVTLLLIVLRGYTGLKVKIIQETVRKNDLLAVHRDYAFQVGSTCELPVVLTKPRVRGNKNLLIFGTEIFYFIKSYADKLFFG